MKTFLRNPIRQIFGVVSLVISIWVLWVADIFTLESWVNSLGWEWWRYWISFVIFGGTLVTFLLTMLFMFFDFKLRIPINVLALLFWMALFIWVIFSIVIWSVPDTPEASGVEYWFSPMVLLGWPGVALIDLLVWNPRKRRNHEFP
ncbi:hypothetical protein M1545_02940 [Patescibacteria group bacterium]|nr:hypothetical protein [Patescibacteria group bacterium]